MATANVRAVITADDKASGVLSRFASNIERTGKRVLKVTAGFGIAAATIGVKTAADLETARQGFIALLGTAEDADKTIARIKREAVRTPFEVGGLVTATQLLSQVTKDGDKSIDVLLDVGEALAFAGKGQAELDRVIINLQQIANTGKITALDLKQFGFAGINIAELLAAHFDTTKERAMDMIKTSDDAFGDLVEAFDKATSEGGQFFGAFDKQQGTFNQQLSNLKDSFNLAMADIVVGTGLFGALSDAIGNVGSTISDNSDTITSVLKAAGKVVENFVKASLEQLRQIWKDIEPNVRDFARRIQEDLIPAISELWKEYIEPLVPVIRDVFVGALKLALDWLGKLITFLSNNKEVVLAFAIAIGTVVTAMKISAAVQAFKLLLTTNFIGPVKAATASLTGGAGLRGALKSFGAFIKSPVMLAPWAAFGAAAVGAFVLIQNKAKETKRVLDNTNKALDRAFEFDRATLKRAQDMRRLSQTGFVSPEASSELDRKATAIFDSFKSRGGRQLGGNVTAGSSFLVGEGSGNPEIFTPSRSGRVDPIGDFGGAGSTVNLNVNIGMFSGTRVERRKIAEMILDDIREIASSKGMTTQEFLGI